MFGEMMEVHNGFIGAFFLIVFGCFMATILRFIQGSMYQLVYASSHILDKPFGSSWWSTYVQSENLDTFW